MKNILNRLLALTLIISVFSCGTSSNTPAPSTSTQSLLIGKWKVSTITLTDNGQIVNYLSIFPFLADDTQEFKANGTTTYDPNILKVDPAQQTETLNYTLSANGKSLTLGPIVTEVLQLDATTLRLKIPDISGIQEKTFKKM